MDIESAFKKAASLIGDPTRATMMWSLLDGKALTATELAIAAETSPQNVSMHLSKLLQAGLLRVEIQGRHRYYTFANKDIAYIIESMANLLPHAEDHHPDTIEKDPAIKYCRTCYDHLAGKVGVAVTDALLKQQIISNKSHYAITKKGEKWFAELGIDTDALKQQRRSFLRPCLDWSERRHHIAGSLAAALLETMISADWLRKTKNSRAMIITAKGEKTLFQQFSIKV